MSFNKKEFARFLLEEEVLCFGDFTLKSGRVSPHFFNSGKFDCGRSLNCLGEYYANFLATLPEVDMIFGPAYKGIPLAVTVACAYERLYQKSMKVLFDRKEAKDHAEGGLFVGRLPKETDKIILIDDVISSGISLKESCKLLKKHFNILPSYAIVAVDRQEKGQSSDCNASEELEKEYGVKLHSLIKLSEVVDIMQNEKVNGKIPIDDNQNKKVKEYLNTYGGH